MKFEIDNEALAPIIEATVRKTISELTPMLANPEPRMAYTEAEAGGLFGVGPHVLRDARIRGEIDYYKIGKRVMYRPADLAAWLDKNRNR